MNRYTDIFFDLDRTLWDFDRNSEETLAEIYALFDLEQKLNRDFTEFQKVFKEMNFILWEDFRTGEKTKEEMRISRFMKTFKIMGFNDLKMAYKTSAYYMSHCPVKENLVPGAIELLTYLRKKYRLHLITNGFIDAQDKKITHAGLRHFFEVIIISEETGYRKPQREIFRQAMRKAACQPKKSLMIGDDWNRDVFGAKKAGMDQVFFNRSDRSDLLFIPTFTIKALEDLFQIL